MIIKKNLLFGNDKKRVKMNLILDRYLIIYGNETRI